MTPVTIVVVGAGQRGTGYARWALRHPDRARVVAVAEPREVRRARFAAEHGIPAGDAAADWRRTRRAAAGSWRRWSGPGSCWPWAT
jgi:predicted dehydrogenase